MVGTSFPDSFALGQAPPLQVSTENRPSCPTTAQDGLRPVAVLGSQGGAGSEAVSREDSGPPSLRVREPRPRAR